MKIDTIEQWNKLAASLRQEGRWLFQMQYGCDRDEGFHAWFTVAGRPDVEVVTYNRQVQDRIVEWGGKNQS